MMSMWAWRGPLSIPAYLIVESLSCTAIMDCMPTASYITRRLFHISAAVLACSIYGTWSSLTISTILRIVFALPSTQVAYAGLSVTTSIVPVAGDTAGLWVSIFSGTGGSLMYCQRPSSSNLFFALNENVF
ncbi:hypothetical protein DFH07DRAFT_851160 [Mycena maculata]|uniref:Uncharacterized protein n=1 Tax=Mycena maculata TaxID=230809 RepID=A0AAD7HU79_9AGAR|nr:hypothetical protein DFH07DRAFT_851160 [Mycena maculata]